MHRSIEEEIIDEIIKNEQRERPGREDPCCPSLLEEPWPTWVPALARRTPDEALRLLGSGWSGLAPGHVEAHLRRLGLNRREGERSRSRVFVIRGRGERGSGAGWIQKEFLTAGDLILLSEGERVPADLRLLRVRDFRVDEGTLTGRGRPVVKAPQWPGEPRDLEPTGIPDLCFRGTRVVSGTATALVVATGDRALALTKS